MKKFLFAILVLMMICSPTSARADGIIIPEPPICDPFPCAQPVPPISQLQVKYHHVSVMIEDQIAITKVDQVFYNPNSWSVEGEYLFPLPQDAVVTNFKLWIDGEPVSGAVLDADQARQRYEEIVRSLQDPALLEYAGSGAVQAHIFPIPSQTERRVELEYTQALTADHGLVRYVYPLNTEKFSASPLESVSVSVEIKSSTPIRAVYSPSHPVAITRSGEDQASASYEEADITPDSDFALFYSLGETPAFHLLTYRDPSDPSGADGYFLALIAPSPEVSAQPQPKDVLLVLDHSGSMEGEKMEQARQALIYILEHLNPQDRFNIIGFSSAVETFASGLRPASQAAEARGWVESISAAGSTDINRALLEAASLVQPERPTYLIFLTDGLPTEGEIDSAKILNNLADSAPTNLRLFVFGVGYDVDTFLLDSLAQAHHGASAYIFPEQNLDEIVSGFYDKISTPVLTSLSLDFGNMSVYDLYPMPLPDLFRGGQIIAAGRYRGGGVANIILSGDLNGVKQTLTFPEQVFTTDSQGETGPLAALPRLWATRKIGYLLNQVRLQGAEKELVEQIVRLSIRYGIVTPYTSYLVTEPAALGASAQNEIAGAAIQQWSQAPAAPVSGQKAVQDAAGQSALAQAESAPVLEASAAGQVKFVGSRTFLLVDGVWTDTTFDPDTMQARRVVFLSTDYFNLAKASPETAAALALGQQVLVLVEGTAYQTYVDPNAAPAADSPTPDPTAAPDAAPDATQAALQPLPSPTSQPTPQPAQPPANIFPTCPGSAAFMLLAMALVFRPKLRK